jgi:hypothetical protein
MGRVEERVHCGVAEILWGCCICVYLLHECIFLNKGGRHGGKNRSKEEGRSLNLYEESISVPSSQTAPL